MGIILKSFAVEGVFEVLEGEGIIEDLDCVLLITTVRGASQRERRQTICDGVFLSPVNNWTG